MTWYVTDLARYRSERQQLEELAAHAQWLTPIGWRVDEAMRLIFDGDIVVSERTYQFSLRFPEHFPYTPPSVLPRDGESRWSGHQFANGELCLEYRPDNWTPDLTGVHLVESTHRLLLGENPAPGDVGRVASAHVSTLGQRLRTEFMRLLVTRNLAVFVAGLPTGAVAKGKAILAFRKTGMVCFVEKLTLESEWEDKSLPPSLGVEYFTPDITVVNVDTEMPAPKASSAQELDDYCAQIGVTLDTNYVIFVRGFEISAFSFFRDDNRASEIVAIPPELEVQRLDPSHAALKEKSVALIGGGSLGSKIGVSLARCGVGSFLVIDGDVLQPDNMVRHDLDWRDVGMHKADAVARRIELVNPAAKTRTRRIQIGGQESSGTAETAISALAECDLIIDATANARVLNIVSTVAASVGKPILWAEVFAGGIGGLIARCRPDHEPPPQYMRRAIENWFADRDAPIVRAAGGYGGGTEDVPLIADDADVAVIGAHAARLAIDILLGRDPSLFPHSAYAIGLGLGSVFSQPFETFPISVGEAPSPEEQASLTQDERTAELARIIKLFTPK